MWKSPSAESKQASSLYSFKKLFHDNCRGGACGGGVVCPWVAGRLGAKGGHESIAVRFGLSCRPGTASAGSAGSAPARGETSVFFSMFLFLICREIVFLGFCNNRENSGETESIEKQSVEKEGNLGNPDIKRSQNM